MVGFSDPLQPAGVAPLVWLAGFFCCRLLCARSCAGAQHGPGQGSPEGCQGLPSRDRPLNVLLQADDVLRLLADLEQGSRGWQYGGCRCQVSGGMGVFC